MSILLGITECAALPAGFFGFLGDQIGNSRLALLSFSSLILASSMMLLPALFSTLLLARFGIGFALNVSFVAVQNYVTSQFSLEMRDKVTGALELSYSISALTIVPLLGLVYEAFGLFTLVRVGGCFSHKITICRLEGTICTFNWHFVGALSSFNLYLVSESNQFSNRGEN
jgi:MFS family permease